MRKNQDRKAASLKAYARYSSLAVQMIVIIGAGVWGGIRLDDRIHTGFPLFTILLSLLSVTFALYYSVRDLIGSNKK